MSDGPHRSLPMRSWWKQAALRADRSAFDLTECAEAIEVALEREFSEELRPVFLKGLNDAHEKPGLFGATESIRLQKLSPRRHLSAGFSIMWRCCRRKKWR